MFTIAIGLVWLFANWDANTPTRSLDDSSSELSDEEALEALKRRYASGELDDAEFERQLETLLENETLDDVENRVTVDPDQTDDGRDRRSPRPETRPGWMRVPSTQQTPTQTALI
ncbi:SHOCT domain-containing protein [Natronorubrum aibiense]|uniref:SHOCT domain-containing protein n=1 Tax=Natronorubrum aibiense TaxID=348826 RepID=A0A5P9P8W8_9EURY|nr:SHOCT domain-containing protein [Natronorubrum aibiense]QFU84330.1 hypothetical protein GCU68_17335 [Natronorubrum aibiense]